MTHQDIWQAIDNLQSNTICPAQVWQKFLDWMLRHLTKVNVGQNMVNQDGLQHAAYRKY